MTRLPEPSHDKRRPGERAPLNVNFGDIPSVGQAVDQIAKRLLHDALVEQTAAYWNRRAETFAAVGTPSCNEIAQACRNRAALAPYDDFRDVVAQVLREVA